MENVGDCHLGNGWDKDFGEQALVLAMAPSPIQQRSCGPQCHGVSLEMSTTKHLLAGEGGKLSMADSAWELGVSSDPCQGARAGISKINTKFKIEKKERTGWQCPQAVCVCGGGGCATDPSQSSSWYREVAAPASQVNEWPQSTIRASASGCPLPGH